MKSSSVEVHEEGDDHEEEETGSEKQKPPNTKRLPLSINAGILLVFCMMGGVTYIAAGEKALSKWKVLITSCRQSFRVPWPNRATSVQSRRSHANLYQLIAAILGVFFALKPSNTNVKTLSLPIISSSHDDYFSARCGRGTVRKSVSTIDIHSKSAFTVGRNKMPFFFSVLSGEETNGKRSFANCLAYYQRILKDEFLKGGNLLTLQPQAEKQPSSRRSSSHSTWSPTSL